MIFNSNNNNDEIFVATIKKWLQQNNNEKIFVIVLNSQQKEQISKLLDNNKIFNKNIVILTFWGLIYNTISDNKDFLSKKIKNLNLIGLDTSQYILKSIIKNINFKDYKSQINIIHQLFRRYSLIIQNDLTQDEVEKLSKIAGENYIDETKDAIEQYRQKTNELGCYDYLRQFSIFKYLITNTNCLKDIKYLTVFNCDEFSLLFYDFLKIVKPNLNDYLIFYDKFGSTRMGYLCAYKNCEQKLLEIFNCEIKKIKTESKYKNLIEKLEKQEEIHDFFNNEFLYRNQMIEKAQQEIQKLLSDGVKPDKIAIISPIIDDALKFNLGLENFYFLSGNTKLIDDFVVKNVVFCFELLTNKKDLSVQTFELKNFLNSFFDMDTNDTPIKFYENCEKIQTLKNGLKNIEFLSEKLTFLYKNLYEKHQNKDHNKQNINFLIKQIKDFEKVFEKNAKIDSFQTEILSQLKISVISENSSEVEKIPQDKIIVSTEQKFIDDQFQKDYVFLLDATSYQWLKNDIGPMYNAWVMQKDYPSQTFEIEDNIRFSNEKLDRIFRKILLSVNKEIYFYSSVYDSMGAENYSGLTKFFKEEKQTEEKIVSKFVPRDDQKKVLDYKNKNLAIAAVPGAGKTTILLELVKKLISNNIKSENIFVLTYMDSAAKNFKERLKNVLPQNANLPNISTIHGLALRIIKENSNFSKLNLDENFEIIDDTKRSILFSQSFFANKCQEDYYSDFERGISIMKFIQNPDLSNIQNTKDIKLKQFVKVYQTYCNLLKENNLIDYDDMLIFALKILKENHDILKYYQNICHYIIEDEAQDSSNLQQELITLLSGKHKNLIRCGDINQAITSTFTNADIEGFKNFIKNNSSLQMTSSQRCAKQISDFANKLVRTFKNSFYQIQITQVDKKEENKENAIFYNKFKNETEEIIDIANKIKNIQMQNKNANIAILVRNNYQVEKYETILNENNIKTIVKEGTLGQQKVFSVIFSILDILNNSKDFDKYYKNLCQYGFYEKDKIFNETNQFWWDLEYFKKLSTLNYSNLITKIGYFYFTNDIDRANVEILSFLTKRICNDKPTFQELINEFEKLSKKPMGAFLKFFENNTKTDNTSKVQIMTIHKSKGDEFDYVFVPEFSLENFPISPENYKIKLEDIFLENIKSINPAYNKKSRDMLQQLICDETLRLIYVAITRAKKQLHISFSKEIKKFNKIKKATELNELLSFSSYSIDNKAF